MRSEKRSPALSEWRAIASLGEQLVNASTLAAQRERILALASRMLRGSVDVWLHENLFRLPDWKQPRAFPLQPRSEGMRRALAKGKRYVLRSSSVRPRGKTLAAIPIRDHGLVLGAIQVTRARGPNFEKPELEILESIADVVATGLYASHRVDVERFRLGELNLVRRVSSEIANVLQLDELSRRVCELIQESFNYYYVAIFTLKPGDTRLRFRSSARAQPKGAGETPLALEVELGQGLIGKAAATGRLITATDVQNDPRYRFVERLPKTRSELVIPLKLENRVLGVLDLQADRVEAFHPNDLLVLQALADNIAKAVEGARLYSDVRRRVEQLALMADVSRSVSSTLELDKMMAEAASLIKTRFGFPHVALFTVHPNRGLIEYEAGSGKRNPASHGYSIRLDDKKGIIPWVARQGKTVLANDVSKEPRYRPSPWLPRNSRSELSVPMTFGDRVLGVLDIQSDKLNAFTEDDQFLFEAVSGTIAASIRNADLYRSEHWRRQVADSLREVAGLISEQVGIEQVLNAILKELERNLPVDVSAIWLLGEDRLSVAAVHGTDAASIERMTAASPEVSDALNRTLLSSEPVVHQPTEPFWHGGKVARFPRGYSSLAAPMRVGEQPVGVIALAHHERGRYGHEARAMVATFASYAAVAIENTRLYDAAQERAYVSAALLQVAEVVASPIAIDETLESILRMLPGLLGVTSAALFGWEPVRRHFIPRAEFGLSAIAKNVLWQGEIREGQFKLLGAAGRSRKIAVHVLRPKDLMEEWMHLRPTSTTAEALAGSERLLIAVPVLIKSDLLGILFVEEAREGIALRDRRLEILQGIAQQIAIALQNDLLQNEMVVRERLETEAELARQIQKTFMPEVLPQREGWEVATRWQTARQVGGDFYDVVELSEGKLGFFIADVSDKGMPAALFMALTRTLFRAVAAETQSPSQVIRRMNELLVPDTRNGTFVTAAYGVLDPNTGEFTYANAGHSPPLWIRITGDSEMLGRTAMALGVINDFGVTERSIKIERGESVLLYTDGLTEAFSPTGDLFGETRLQDTIDLGLLLSAESLLDGLLTSLNDFTGTLPLADDLTLLAIKRL